MEFLKASRRKSLFSELLHIVLNIALAAALFGLVATGSVALAFVLILVSKWRILAVRMRYWWANILANTVDLTVSMSTVILLYLAGTSEVYGLTLQIFVAILYALWLTAVKPRSRRHWIVVQAGVGLVAGSWAAFAVSYLVPVSVMVIAMYIIAFGAARHVLVSREEDQPSLLAMVFGLFMAEIAWVVYHWTVAYGADELGDFKLPQSTVTVGLVGFLIYRLYALHSEGKSLKSVEAIVPTVFVAAVIFVLSVFFSAGAGII